MIYSKILYIAIFILSILNRGQVSAQGSSLGLKLTDISISKNEQDLTPTIDGRNNVDKTFSISPSVEYNFKINDADVLTVGAGLFYSEVIEVMNRASSVNNSLTSYESTNIRSRFLLSIGYHKIFSFDKIWFRVGGGLSGQYGMEKYRLSSSRIIDLRNNQPVQIDEVSKYYPTPYKFNFLLTPGLYYRINSRVSLGIQIDAGLTYVYSSGDARIEARYHDGNHNLLLQTTRKEEMVINELNFTNGFAIEFNYQLFHN